MQVRQLSVALSLALLFVLGVLHALFSAYGGRTSMNVWLEMLSLVCSSSSQKSGEKNYVDSVLT